MTNTTAKNRSMNPRTLLAYGITGITAALLGVLMAWIMLQKNPSDIPDGGSTVALQQPREIMPFAVIDESGQPVSALAGGWSMAFFGFVNCPDICPQTLHLLQQMIDTLRADTPTPTVYLVSVDPARDTAAKLQQYVAAFNPNFKALTGPEAEIKKLAQSMGAAFFRAPGGSDDDYTMNHTAAVFVVNPQGKLAGYSNAPHSVESLRSAYQTIVKAKQ